MNRKLCLVFIAAALTACGDQASEVAAAARGCAIDPQNLKWQIVEVKNGVTDTQGGPTLSFDVLPADSSPEALQRSFRAADCLAEWGADNIGSVIDQGYPRRLGS